MASAVLHYTLVLGLYQLVSSSQRENTTDGVMAKDQSQH